MNTFEITIQRRSGDGWPIVAEYSRQGAFLPIRKEGQFQVDEQSLLEQPSALAYGTVLGRAVFQDEIRSIFLQAIASSDEPLHVLLLIEPKEIRTLRWERLCAPFDGTWDFLAQQQRTPFSLYLPSIIDRLFPAIGRRDLRALVAVACPQSLGRYGLTDFDAEASAAAARQALGPIPSDLLLPATLDALCEKLTTGHYTLLHIVCHGKFDKKQSDTSLFLADADNHVSRVSGTQLLDRLRQLPSAQARGLPHFAFLASCESALPEAEAGLGGLAQRLVRDLGMPAVLAMTDKITTSTAQTLTERFYQQLCIHGEVDRALTEAMSGLAARQDITVPVICSRLGGRPLFSDMPDRRLTESEIRFGLEQMEIELPIRAPVLVSNFLQYKKTIDTYVEIPEGALSNTIKRDLDNARTEIGQICKEVLSDIPFEALALGAALPSYDARCPFPGLAAFQVEDSKCFFGRSELVKSLLSKLADCSFLAVLGPSGSGKSSLVLAGLVPAVQESDPNTLVFTMKPGSEPVAQLGRALADLARPASAKMLLVVDQFEELFTLCLDDNQRRAFVNTLLGLLSTQGDRQGDTETHDNIRVVVTLRDDFWRDCAQFPELSRTIEAHHQLVGPMNAGEMRSSMEEQAHVVSLRFEADLVSTIIEDVQDEPGAMPLLQHALSELWKRRHGSWLLLKEYNAIGGVRGAIAFSADGVYEGLGSEQQREQVRNIFARLTHLVEEAAQVEDHWDTRQRVSFEDLVAAGANPADTRTLVANLASARLIVTSLNQVTNTEELEVAHEALIRYWPRLRAWIHDDRGDYQLRQQLNEAARLWQLNGSTTDFLVHRGRRLTEAERLIRRPGFTNALEGSYFDACVAQRRLEQRRTLKIARLTTVVALLSLASFFMLMVMSWTTLRAEKIADMQLETESRRLANLSLEQLTEDPVASLDLGLRALPIAESKPYVPEAEFALDQALRASTERHYLNVSTTHIAGDQISLGKQWIAVGGDGVYLVPYSLDASKVVTLADSIEKVKALAWYTDGETLLSRSVQAIKIWEDAKERGSRSSSLPITCAEWRPGHTDVAVCNGQNLRLWSYAGDTYERIADFAHGIERTLWSQDGRRLAAWDTADVETGQTLVLWNSLDTQNPLTATETYADRITAFAWSPNGEVMAAALASGQLEIRSLDATAKALRVLVTAEKPAKITGITFVDATRFISWGYGDVARLWSLDGRQIHQFGTTTNFAQEVTLTPDHEQLLVYLRDGGAELWDVATGERLGVFVGHSMPVLSADRRNTYLATGSADGTVRIWNIPACETACSALMVLRGYVNGSVQGRADVLGVHWLDDRQLLTWSEDGALRIWRVFDEQGKPICDGADLNGVPLCFGFSRSLPITAESEQAPTIQTASWLDDNTVVTTDDDAVASRFSLQSGQHTTWKDNSGRRPAVIWDPEGRLIFAYVDYPGSDGPGEVWDPDTNELLSTVPGPITKAFWLDAGLLVSNETGAARLIAPESGKVMGQLREITSSVTAAIAHPNGQLATGEDDGAVRIWNLQTGQQLALLGHGPYGSTNGSVKELHWTADGKRILVADGKVSLWDVETQQELWTSVASGLTTHIALSPDESLVAATLGANFYVFDQKTGAVRWHNQTHTQPLHGIQWVHGARWANQERSGALLGNLVRWSNGGPWHSDDDRLLLLTWGGDGTARLWDWETEIEIARLRQPSPVKVAALSPDGTHLLTAGLDGAARVWDTWLRAPRSMVTAAQDRLTRPLASEQLQAFSLQP